MKKPTTTGLPVLLPRKGTSIEYGEESQQALMLLEDATIAGVKVRQNDSSHNVYLHGCLLGSLP